MLYSGVRRLAGKLVARNALRCSLAETRVLYCGYSARYLSTTSVRRSSDNGASAVTTAAASTVEQTTPIASTVNETVVRNFTACNAKSPSPLTMVTKSNDIAFSMLPQKDARNVEGDFESIYAGDYLPHNTEIYKDFLAMEQAEKIVDISAASDVTISQIAEGLSTDLLAASGVVPTLQDMGLGSYYNPAGWVQNALDLLHTAGLPWWVAIASTTLVIKTLLFPVVIRAQRNSTNFNNNLSEMQRIQLKMTVAQRSGNALEVSRASNELTKFMKKNDVNPIKSIIPILAQAPVFLSFLIGLRGMANLPMESMKTGGIYWFTDLTIPDPYFILPLVTCTTVFIMLETGADGLTRADNMRLPKYVMRAIPVLIFPFIMNFPAAVLCYWTTSNFFSLGQTILLRRPAIRAKFNIPALKINETKDLPLSKGFVQDMKDSYTNMKLSNEIGNRARVDEMRFKKAGTGPIVKTIKDPKKIEQTANN